MSADFGTSEREETQNLTPAERIDSIDLPELPNRFFRLCGCCAISCCYWDYPSCIGCNSNCHAFCIDQDAMFCKMFYAQPDSCCLLMSGGCDVTTVQNILRCHEQLFCFECVLAPTGVKRAYNETNVAQTTTIPGKTDGSMSGREKICGGCCCIVNSCNLDCPGALGCYGKGLCICLESEDVCCRPLCGVTRSDESLLCILTKANFALKWPQPVIRRISQLFCLESACALPCATDVPRVCGGLPFCLCYSQGAFGVRCCVSFNDAAEANHTSADL